LISRHRWNGSLLDHRLQDGDLSRETPRDCLGEAAVESFQRFRLEEMAPGRSPSFQLDLWPEKMLDLDDPGVEVGQVRGSARLAVLEMQTDLKPPSHAVGPDLVVNPVMAVVELEQHRVGAVPKSRELGRHLLPSIGHHGVEEIAPGESGSLTALIRFLLRTHVQVPLTTSRVRWLARTLQYAKS